MVLEIQHLINKAEDKGWSAEELFQKAGVAWITLYRYRKGKYQPRLETLHKLTNALND